jgi:hypothetical protein
MEPLCPSLSGEYDKYTYQYGWWTKSFNWLTAVSSTASSATVSVAGVASSMRVVFTGIQASSIDPILGFHPKFLP